MSFFPFLRLVFQLFATANTKADAFLHRVGHPYDKFELRNQMPLSPTLLSVVPHYGPPSSSDNEYENTNGKEFRNLVNQVMKTSQPEHLPRLLANNIELIMELKGDEGAQIISSVLEDADKDGDSYTQTLQTVETILSFAEDFVEQAQEMDANNKQLLGKILKAMVTSEHDQSVSGGEGAIAQGGDESNREAALDRVMKEEKKKFTSGFLRHLEGECDRITNQPKITQESARLLEILRMIQTRVLEELGQDLGEAALVLGQLMGYEKEEELLGVLDAGLTIRGNEFALEMASLTEEALDGFSKIPGGADPGLVEKVLFIDRRLREFLNETNAFQ